MPTKTFYIDEDNRLVIDEFVAIHTKRQEAARANNKNAQYHSYSKTLVKLITKYVEQNKDEKNGRND